MVHIINGKNNARFALVSGYGSESRISAKKSRGTFKARRKARFVLSA